MVWGPPQPTHPKYRTKEHRHYRDGLLRKLRRDGFLICTADVCVLDSRLIANSNGRARDGLHAGHEDDGATYRGPQHNACNVKDGSTRANAKRKAQPRRWPA